MVNFLGFILLLMGEVTPNPVLWTGAASRSSARIRLHAQIDSGWHMYAMNEPEDGPVPLEITSADGTGFTIKSVRPSKPVEVFDPNFRKRVNLYADKAEFAVTLSNRFSGTVGTLALQVRYQCCNDSVCLPPKNVDVPITVH